jgi:c-di-GMP-binding flagellar brake protein YcgR
MSVPNLDNREFNLLNQVNCGETVHLQIITATKRIRLKTRLIGVDPNMSVILAFMNDPSWDRALPYIKESNDVIVRFMHKKRQQACIIAFRSSIQKIMTITGRWLVLDYPKAIESAEIRQHRRVTVNIEASLTHPDTQVVLSMGLLSDISFQGCAFVSKDELALNLDDIYILSVDISDEGKKVELSVTLKNIQKITTSSEFQYGLIFNSTDEKLKDSLQYLLLHHLQK